MAGVLKEETLDQRVDVNGSVFLEAGKSVGLNSKSHKVKPNLLSIPNCHLRRSHHEVLSTKFGFLLLLVCCCAISVEWIKV